MITMVVLHKNLIRQSRQALDGVKKNCPGWPAGETAGRLLRHYLRED